MLSNKMNSAKRPATKASKGSVGIENLKGRIRLNFPRQWFNGQQKRVSIGLEWNNENLKFAEAITRQMELDWLAGVFDVSLNKYLPNLEKQLNNVVDLPNKRPEMGLLELWDKYCEYRRPSLAVTTYRNSYQKTFTKFVNDALNAVGDDAIAIINWLIDNRNKKTVSDVLVQLSHAHAWGIEQGYISNNPYKKLVDELKQSKATRAKKRNDGGSRVKDDDTDDDIKAFSVDEVAVIINAYETSNTLKLYAPLVRLLFYTGCRPGEAIALRWKHIKKDCTVITFQDSYDPATKTTKDTKTYVDRIFRVAVGSKLHTLLKELESKRTSPDDVNELVLKNKKDKQYDWRIFVRTWRGGYGYRSIIKDLVEEGKIKQYLKAYATRHTFITANVNAGYPAHVIAAWVGNSADMIWEHYFDKNQKDITSEVF